MGRIGSIQGIKLHSDVFKKISKILSETKSVVLDSVRKNNVVYSTVLPVVTKILDEERNFGDLKVEVQETVFGESETPCPSKKGEILSMKLFYSHLQSAVEMERNLYISSTPSSSSSPICTASPPQHSSPLLLDVTDKCGDHYGSGVLPCNTDSSYIQNISELKFEDSYKSEIVAVYNAFLNIIAECLS